MLLSRDEISQIEKRVLANYATVVVDALVVDTSNTKLLLQKRSPTRRLFPNMWDPLGGHLESNEGIFECLSREIKEESSMDLIEIISLVNEFEWDSDRSVINLQFLCRAKGEPIPELGKVTEIRWIAQKELHALDDSLTEPIKNGVKKAFKILEALG